MDSLEAQLFKRMFRVDYDTFYHVLDKIEPHFNLNVAKAINSSNQPIVLKTRLAVSL